MKLLLFNQVTTKDLLSLSCTPSCPFPGYFQALAALEERSLCCHPQFWGPSGKVVWHKDSLGTELVSLTKFLTKYTEEARAKCYKGQIQQDQL